MLIVMEKRSMSGGPVPTFTAAVLSNRVPHPTHSRAWVNPV